MGADPLDCGPLLLLQQGVRAEVGRLVNGRLARWKMLRHGVLQILHGSARGLLMRLRTGARGVGRYGVDADR